MLEAGDYIKVVISDLSISFPGVEIEGDFSFKTATKEGVEETIVVGNNVRVFVGDNTGGTLTGLELINGTSVLIQEGELEAGYVTGTVRLLGVDGITLQATMTVSLNEFNNTISDTYIIDGEEVAIDFGTVKQTGSWKLPVRIFW